MRRPLRDPPGFLAYIFDFDGLLVDSEPIWDEAWYRFLDRYAIPRARGEEVMERGMGMYESIAALQLQASLEGQPDELVAEWSAYFYELVRQGGGFCLMPGARELVTQAAGLGQVALATCGHPREIANDVLGKVGLAKFFQLVMSCDEVERGKPYPDIYLEVAARLGVAPESCLV